jgi:hypothetical protein
VCVTGAIHDIRGSLNSILLESFQMPLNRGAAVEKRYLIMAQTVLEEYEAYPEHKPC